MYTYEGWNVLTESHMKGIYEMIGVLVGCLNSGYSDALRDDVELALSGDYEYLCQLLEAFEEIEEITCE